VALHRLCAGLTVWRQAAAFDKLGGGLHRARRFDKGRRAAMDVSVILMVVGDDRPGLTQALADAVVSAGGNWLESHLARLGDKYVGSVLVELPGERLGDLKAAAAKIDAVGFDVRILPASDEPRVSGQPLSFELVGRDRPGIVQEVTTALAGVGANIEELETSTEQGAMDGGALFRARARVTAPQGADVEIVRRALEGISGEIMVDFD
jgi:glycine cleavage system regulatory protein